MLGSPISPHSTTSEESLIAPSRVGVPPKAVAKRVRWKMDALLACISDGMTVNQACEKVGVSKQSYAYYKRAYPDFRASVNAVRGIPPRDEAPVHNPVPDFPEFCEKYLGFRVFDHALQWYDILEGRPPRDLHPSIRYEQGDPDLLVVNTPPAHAKSTVITVAYTTWRIVKDPRVRIVIVSKAERLAKQFLLTIKTFLTHPQYAEMQDAFAPPGGYTEDSASWRADLIYVGSNLRDTQEKDPTVQAIGIGGQLYGARADLVILDDCVDNLNAGDFDKQCHWVQTEVVSRIPDGGKVLVVGTRMAAQDLYSELRNPERYSLDEGEPVPWTYLAQPAVLEFAERAEDWATLWPRCDKPTGAHQRPDADGLYPKWPGVALDKRRRRMPPTSWARVYQQEQVAADAVFPLDLLRRAVGGYAAGLMADADMSPGRLQGRSGGMVGLKIIAGLDPATTGFTAAVVVGLDPATGIRWVLDCHNQAGMLPHETKGLIRAWTLKYGVHEWRVERNSFQGFLTRDVELRQWVASQGSVLGEHWTGANKVDPEMGVASMTALFANDLIRLPRTDQKAAAKALVDQFAVWAPGMHKSVKTDLVMALWFCEMRCAELMRFVSRQDMFDRGGDWFVTQWDSSTRSITDTLGDEMHNMPVPSIWSGAA